VKGPRRPIRNWLTKQRGSPAYLAERRSEVPTGTLGEIQIRGHNVMKGYWNLPQAIAAAIIDGWFATGDIGCVDEDGYFFVANHNQTPFGAGQHRPWHSRQRSTPLDAVTKATPEQLQAFCYAWQTNIP
jgi:non-ribosomal peptide synthetase component F